MSIRLDYYSAKKYVQLECADVGKGIQFHPADKIKGPYTDGDTIHVQEPNGLWGDDEWGDWEYEVYHEIGHESPENCSPHWKDMVKEKGVSIQNILGNMWNLMSDHIQEHNRVGKYAGRDKVLKKGRMRFVRDRLLSDEVVSQEYDTKEGRIFKVVSIYDTLCRENWNEYLKGGTQFIAQSLDGEEGEMYDKLIKANIPIHTGTNEEDAYQFAKDILNALDEDADEHEKQAQEQRKQEEGGDNGDGEGQEGGEKGAKGEQGKGELSDKAKEEIEGLSAHVHYTKPEKGKGYSTSKQGIEITYGDTSRFCSSFVPRNPVVVDIKKEIYPSGQPDRRTTDDYLRDINKIQGGELLMRQVRSLIVAAKQSRYEQGRKRGRVSPKNLWKAASPLYDSRVFRKKVDKLEKNTAVTIVTDNSGSMCGEKFCHAAKAGVMLSNALTKANVPVELISFSEESPAGPVNIIVKSFNESRVSGEELAERYAKCSSFMGSNSDGESIMWAAQRLGKRDEERRVMIVLSDGQPASFYGEYGSEYVYTKYVVDALQSKSCPLELYGIGLMSDSVKNFYKDYSIIKHANELEAALLQIVKSKVLGG